MRAFHMKRRAAYVSAGRCAQCGAPRDAGSDMYCRMHILKLAAYRWLDNVTLWRELDDLLKKQGERCAYTGEPLLLGQNASLDHKIPRSRGGANVIDNVQWLSWTANRCKTDLTHDEFVALCATVASKAS